MARQRTLNQHATLFLAGSLVTALCVFLIGWFTDIRGVAHGALISVAAVAFLPFTILGIGLALGVWLMMLSAMAAILGGGGDIVGLEVAEPFAEATMHVAPKYYRWLAKQRHPAFWGVGAGVLLGGSALWMVIGTVIVPREPATTDALIVAQQLIEQRFANT